MKSIIITIFSLVVGLTTSFAQSTEFSYQGRLLDSSMPANASYDFEFRLFAAESGGSAIGTTSRLGVPVSNGVFTVKLDFGASFDGSPRWLEIALKPTGGPTLTTLAPRQQITSAPYAIRSLNSETAQTAMNSSQLGGVAANQYVVTTDPRMSDARVPTAGSADYIQNTAVQQAASNFNVSGSGILGGTLTANAVTSATQFNIGVNRALALGTSASLFAGRLSGVSNTTGSGNTFVGDSAGRFNTSAANNSFFGREAGVINTASNNSFFGAFAGDSNTTGTRNSFFGVTSGDSNQIGNDNAFFGYRAGRLNSADGNSFFGSQSGDSITTGANNAFFGYRAGAAANASDTSFFGYQAGAVNNVDGSSFFGAFAGDSNTTGANNSFFGNSAGTANVTGSDNSFFGFQAGLSNTAGNNSFFGSHAGDSNTTATRNSFFGSMAGQSVTIGSDNSFFGALSGANTTSANNSFFGSFAGHFNTQGNDNAFFGTGSGYNNSTGDFNSFYGSRAGEFSSTSSGNSFFGFRAGNANDGSGNTFVGRSAGVSNTDGDNNTFVGNFAGSATNTIGNNNTALGAVSGMGADNLQYATAIGAGAVVSTSNTIVLGRTSGADRVRIYGLGAAGSIGLCLNFNNEVSACSSSLRYEKNVKTFTGGSNIARRLRPVSSEWIEGGANDVRFAAEEAIREQRQVIDDQQRQIDQLKVIVCEIKPTASICRGNEEQK